jgi:hypothetical protein
LGLSREATATSSETYEVRELEGFTLPNCIILRVDARKRVMLRVGMIAATPASFAAGNVRYAPEDVSPDVRIGDRATPTIALNLIYLLIPTAEEQT